MPISSKALAACWRRRQCDERIIASVFVSLDGVMQAPGGPPRGFAPEACFGRLVFPFENDQWKRQSARSSIGPRSLAGAKDLRDLRRLLPYAEDTIAHSSMPATKYVATSSNRPPRMEAKFALVGDVAAQIARLKSG